MSRRRNAAPIKNDPVKRHQRFALGILAVATAAATPAQAGLFDFLFGGGRPAVAYAPAYAPGYAPMPGGMGGDVDPAARKAADAARRAAQEKANAEQAARNREVIAKLAEIRKEHGPRAAFMLDPTLRPGDVVVMPSGLEVFEGSRGGQHAANHFRPLSQSKLAKRSDLALLQQVSGLNETERAAPSLAEIRPLTIQGKKKKKPAAKPREPLQAKSTTPASAPRTADARPFFINN